MDLADAKVWLSLATGLHQDALHIHAALLIYLLVLALRRWDLRSPLPFLTVLAVELANEGYDLWHTQAGGEPPRLGESVKDLVNTMLWPAAFLLLALLILPAGRRRAAPPAA